MAKGGEAARQKEMEARMLAAWHDPAERDNSIKARVKRGLQLGSVRAADRLIKLLDSQDERVALAAAREVMQRVYGMPRQEVAMEVKDGSQSHLEALRAIYDKAMERVADKAGEKPIIDHENAETVETVEEQENSKEPPRG